MPVSNRYLAQWYDEQGKSLKRCQLTLDCFLLMALGVVGRTLVLSYEVVHCWYYCGSAPPAGLGVGESDFDEGRQCARRDRHCQIVKALRDKHLAPMSSVHQP